MDRTKHYPGVYMIMNILDKKVYIGYSRSCLRRMQNHRTKLRKNIHSNQHLQNAWNLYGDRVFTYSIIEDLPTGLSYKEYEEVETKWVLYYKSHLKEFGYNKTLPGGIPLYKEEENLTGNRRNMDLLTHYMCISILSGEVEERKGIEEVESFTGVKKGKVCDLANYWTDKGGRRSNKGWIIVRKEEYNIDFDYIEYKTKRVYLKSKVNKTWRDYYKKEKRIKKPEDIIPYSERPLRRIPIVAVNVDTGEEKYYRMMIDCYGEFLRAKVYKCINAPFGKYKHRGHWFRKV
jgi:hypothetical protein